MAKINQIGPGRKTSGTIDGITYVTRKGVTYARALPNMPASAYRSAGALRRQAIFKLVQLHMKYHLRTIRQTFTPKGNGTPCNRYYSVNAKALSLALGSLADRLVAGEDITLTDVETAISTYATAHPTSTVIGHLSGYQDVYLMGAWPSTITLSANDGDNTLVIIVAENDTTTTIRPDGTTTVVAGHTNPTEGTDTNGVSSTGSEPSTVQAPMISGTTPFNETTTVTITGSAEASIYYTHDGSTPTAESTQYNEAIILSDTTTVKAIAIKDAVSSSVTSRTFTKDTAGGDNGGETEE